MFRKKDKNKSLFVQSSASSNKTTFLHQGFLSHTQNFSLLLFFLIYHIMKHTFFSARTASLIVAALIAGYSAAYWANTTGEFSSFLSGLSAGFFALLWGSLVFHKMGESYAKDTLWIILGFVFISSFTGSVLSYGLLPIGIPMGIFVAFTLPFQQPLVIGPLYALGIFLAYWLPRRNNTTRYPEDENKIHLRR